MFRDRSVSKYTTMHREYSIYTLVLFNDKLMITITIITETSSVILYTIKNINDNVSFNHK